MNRVARPLILAAALLVAGCSVSGLLQSHVPPNQLYVLRPAAVAALPATGATLQVERPLPAPGLDGDRLALTRPGNRLDYYAGGRWGAPLPDVLSDLAVTVLRRSGAWTTVADARAGLNADYQLQLYIDHFEAAYGANGDGAAGGSAPQVTVELHGVLVHRVDGRIVTSFAAAATQQAGANRMASVLTAFGAAANAALAQVAIQAASQVAGHAGALLTR